MSFFESPGGAELKQGQTAFAAQASAALKSAAAAKAKQCQEPWWS